MDIVSVDSLLIFKRIFAILWPWDGTAQVHIKKTIYKINIPGPVLLPEAVGPAGRKEGAHPLKGEGDQDAPSGAGFAGTLEPQPHGKSTSPSCFHRCIADA